jgi:hypothetical protein
VGLFNKEINMLCDYHNERLNEKYECSLCNEARKPRAEAPQFLPPTLEEKMEQDGMLDAKDEQFNSTRKY